MAAYTPKPSQTDVDAWMSGNVANVFINDFIRVHDGRIPTNASLTGHIDSFSPQVQVAMVRNDPSLTGLAVHLQNTADVLRWVKIVRDRPAFN